jgi:hypothetical protein
MKKVEVVVQIIIIAMIIAKVLYICKFNHKQKNIVKSIVEAINNCTTLITQEGTTVCLECKICGTKTPL